MVKVFDSGSKGPLVEPQRMFSSLLAPLLHLTYEAGAVDDKDLAVSSNQGNAWLFVHPTLGIMGVQCCTLNDQARLNTKKVEQQNTQKPKRKQTNKQNKTCSFWSKLQMAANLHLKKNPLIMYGHILEINVYICMKRIITLYT